MYGEVTSRKPPGLYLRPPRTQQIGYIDIAVLRGLAFDFTIGEANGTLTISLTLFALTPTRTGLTALSSSVRLYTGLAAGTSTAFTWVKRSGLEQTNVSLILNQQIKETQSAGAHTQYILFQSYFAYNRDAINSAFNQL